MLRSRNGGLHSHSNGVGVLCMACKMAQKVLLSLFREYVQASKNLHVLDVFTDNNHNNIIMYNSYTLTNLRVVFQGFTQ